MKLQINNLIILAIGQGGGVATFHCSTNKWKTPNLEDQTSRPSLRFDLFDGAQNMSSYI